MNDREERKRVGLAPALLLALMCAIGMTMASPASAKAPRYPGLIALGSTEAQDVFLFDPFVLRTVPKTADGSNGAAARGLTGPVVVEKAHVSLPSLAGRPLSAGPVAGAVSARVAEPLSVQNFPVAPLDVYVPPIRIPYRPLLRSPMAP